MELRSCPSKGQVHLRCQHKDCKGDREVQRAVEQPQAQEQSHRARCPLRRALRAQVTRGRRSSTCSSWSPGSHRPPSRGSADRPARGRKPAVWADLGAGRRRRPPDPESRSHWRSAWRLASKPSRTMNNGMTVTVTARIRNERQSDHSTHVSRIRWSDCGYDGGRQVTGEIDLEGFHALGRHRGELAGALAGQPGRSERNRSCQQLPAQCRGHTRRGAVRGQLAQPGQAPPGRRTRPPGPRAREPADRSACGREMPVPDNRAEKDRLGDQAEVDATPTATAAAQGSDGSKPLCGLKRESMSPLGRGSVAVSSCRSR